MKVTLAMVSSLNGKITDGDNPDIYTWTSPEDSDHFSSLKKKYSIIVMGSQTYKNAKRNITLNPKTLRIVMTGNPEKYTSESIPGQLEFTNESPQALVARLEKNKYTNILLVGGSKINASFFRAKLVNEILLTIEPVLFGQGRNLIADSKLRVAAQLENMQKLNSRGTLLLTYTVL